jgi:hypothetical protein
MSTKFTHTDFVGQSAESILTARRLRALRLILTDPDDIHHDQLAALADLIIQLEDEEG